MATTRERLVRAAVDVTSREGWSAVTMAGLAQAAGVSRQTVYNEIGTKNALAEAMIMSELERFLAVVEQAFVEHPADLVDAVEAAARSVLELAQGNPLLHAVVSATHGADTELLPLLTTHAGSLLGIAREVVEDRVREGYEIDLPPERLGPAIEAVVRLVLSHVMEPSGEPARTAADLAWIAARVLR